MPTHLDIRRPNDNATDPQTEGMGLQRRRAREEGMTNFEDQLEEMQSSTQTPDALPSSCTLDDLCSYAPSRACIYLPCKTMWPNASVDDRIDPQLVLDANGNP